VNGAAIGFHPVVCFFVTLARPLVQSCTPQQTIHFTSGDAKFADFLRAESSSIEDDDAT
jgi:hypothetical protein